MNVFDGTVINTFNGRISTFWTTINILFNENTRVLSAATSAAGMPSLQYTEYDPLRTEGEQISTLVSGIWEYTFFWKNTYPFATYTRVSAPPITEVLTLTGVVLNESVINAKDGQVTLTASDGVPPYEYTLNSIDWQSSNIFSGLSAGNYTAFTRDTQSGSGFFKFTILQGEYPTPPPIMPQEKSVIVLANGELERQGAYKRATVKTVFGTTPTKLYNGDFELYNGQNWDQWVKYGGISLSRGQRTVKSGTGAIVPIQNYTLVFNQRADSGKYLEHTAL